MQLKFQGYGAVFFNRHDKGTQYRLDGRTVERVSPTAFNRSLRERHDVVLAYQHDYSRVLARTTSGTLTLTVDSRGLHYSAPANDSDPDHLSVASKVRRGDVTGSSFSFFVIEERYEREGQQIIRWLDDVLLLELGPVSHPAYPSATASLSRSRSEIANQVRARAMKIKCDLMEENLAKLSARSRRESTDGKRSAGDIFRDSWASHLKRIAEARARRDWRAVATIELSQEALREAIGSHNARCERSERIVLEAR